MLDLSEKIYAVAHPRVSMSLAVLDPHVHYRTISMVMNVVWIKVNMANQPVADMVHSFLTDDTYIGKPTPG